MDFDFSKMVDMSRSDVEAVLKECRKFDDGYLDEHSAYLRTWLKKHDGYKRPDYKQRAWAEVEHEARSLIRRLASLRSSDRDAGGK